MAPNHTNSIANVASKKSHLVIDLEMKLKVIADYEGGKSVVVIAPLSGKSHSIIATILKNKNRLTDAVKGFVSLKVRRLTKIREGPISDIEKLRMAWIGDQTQKHISLWTTTIMATAKCLFAVLKDKVSLSAVLNLRLFWGSLNNTRIVTHYIM